MTDAPSYRNTFIPSHTLIDQRDQIGPHYLAIGKTKKIFEANGHLFAFFSTGYQINYCVLDPQSLEVLNRVTLSSISPAWGGGQFCVDCVEDEVHLVFTNRNRLHVGYMLGRCEGQEIVWQTPSLAISGTTPSLAAPWVEAGTDGSVWTSVVGKDGNFIVATRDRQRSWQQKNLFAEDEDHWMHSCVQMLPIGDRRAIAAGFRGTFPTDMELVYKICEPDLSITCSQPIAPCNVNDQLTFHFQALGDDRRGQAHIVYLADNLNVDHAIFENGSWTVAKDIFPFPAFAPQICQAPDGQLASLCVDYEGDMWRTGWSSEGGWSRPERLQDTPNIPISPAYGRTGYGTGGMIAATASKNGTIPFVASQISLDPRAPSSLFAGTVGHAAHLTLAGAPTLQQADKPDLLEVVIPLAGLHKENLIEPGNVWVAHFTDAQQQQAPLTISIQSNGSTTPEAVILSADKDGTVEDVQVRFNDPFGPSSTTAEIRAVINVGTGAETFVGSGVGESYRNAKSTESAVASGQMVDLVPFQPEPNSIVARSPEQLAKTFRRIL